MCNLTTAGERLRAQAPPTHNRRAWVRYRCPGAPGGRVFISGSYASLDATVVDLSRAGIALALPQPVEVGTVLAVELEVAPDIAADLLAEVTSVNAQPDGSWRCGGRLVHELTDAEVRLLLRTPVG